MTAERDIPDLSILYDTARGFLALETRDEVLRHTLLSLIGSCSARFAVWMELMPNGKLIPGLSRGTVPASLSPIGLRTSTVQALIEEPGPYRGDDLDVLGAEGAVLRERHGVRLAVGVVHEGRLLGLVVLGDKLLGEPYAQQELGLVGEITRLASRALGAYVRSSEHDGTRTAPARKERGLELLRRRHPPLRQIVGNGNSTLALYEELLALAPFDFAVLVMGETGTGKELVARALHDLGPNASQPFEVVNCAAIPRDLVASALFGHERGAFTGAVGPTRGAFELAGFGTLLLDEIGDMPFDIQATLLRVLQEQRFRRVGGERVLPAPARVVSATNVDLTAAVQAGRFRVDLFYRIQTYVVKLLPLRERREEIPYLVRHFLRLGSTHGKDAPRASDAFVEEIARRELSGNVRELQSLVLGAVVRARGATVLVPEHLPEDVERRPTPLGPSTTGPEADASASPRTAPVRPIPSVESQTGETLTAETVRSYEEMQRQYIRSVLQLTNGNRRRAAELMDIPRTTLNARMRKLGLDGTSV